MLALRPIEHCCICVPRHACVYQHVQSSHSQSQSPDWNRRDLGHHCYRATRSNFAPATGCGARSQSKSSIYLFACTCKMIPPLPGEVWEAIAEFARSDLLSQVWKRLRKVFGCHSYVKIGCGAEEICGVVGRTCWNIRALYFLGRSIGDSGVQALAALREAPSCIL